MHMRNLAHVERSCDSVPRVTTFDDTIVGKDGSDVELPKEQNSRFGIMGNTIRRRFGARML